jgi:short-subunit dehydrogenase
VRPFHLNDRTALVTGASSGIGRALALALAGAGVRLVLTARRADRLGDVAAEIIARGHASPLIVPGDLAAPGGPDLVFAAARAAAGRPFDILVNNAGAARVGAVADLDVDRLSAMVHLNVDALVRLTRLALPEMIARRDGAILEVASTAAFLPLPYSAVYAATKAFVVSFAAGVHAEVKDHGVRVVCLCPGRTATEFFTAAGYEKLVMSGPGWMTAEQVAAEAMAALGRGGVLHTAGFLNRLFVRVLPFVPRSALRRGAYRVMRKRALMVRPAP